MERAIVLQQEITDRLAELAKLYKQDRLLVDFVGTESNLQASFMNYDNFGGCSITKEN